MPADDLLQGGALLLALFLVWWRAPHQGFPSRYDLLAILGIACVGGALGGRLLWWVAASLRAEVTSLTPLVALPPDAGFSSLGVLGGAAMAGLLVIVFGGYRKHLWLILDFLSPIFFLSLAVARLGCLAHGCDFGVEMPRDIPLLTVRYHDPHSFAWQWFDARRSLDLDGTTPPLFALALWSSVGTLALVTSVSLARRRWPTPWQAGSHTTALLLGYALYRFLLEGARHPSSQAFLTRAEIVSVSRAMLLGLVASMLLLRIGARKWAARMDQGAASDRKNIP